MHFTLKKESMINRDKLYSISIDVENFSTLMPKYFKSITIKKLNKNEIITDQKIHFLSTVLCVKTKHVIFHPRTHEIHILSGPLRNSFFVESYDQTSNGTSVTIDVSIKLRGVFKILLPFRILIKMRMTKVMDEFLNSAEKLAFNSKE